MNMSQVLKYSRFGGRPTLDAPAIFRGIYRDCQEQHLSLNHFWLLIRECSNKSTCTKSIKAEMETEEAESPFISKHIAQINPGIPSCVKGSTWVPLNYV